MKKLFVLVVLLSGGAFIMNAQNVKIGAKAGINFASLTGDITGAKGRTAFHLGGMAEFSFSKKFSLQPELLLSFQGAKIATGNINITYITIPVMAKYYLIEGLSLEGGLQMGLLLSAKQEAGNQTVDIKNTVKSLDFGVDFGAAYKLDSGVSFGLRYNIGLSNANDSPGSTGTIKNGVFQISVGYFFL